MVHEEASGILLQESKHVVPFCSRRGVMRGHKLVDMWGRTKGSLRLGYKVGQLNATATGWRCQGKDMKTEWGLEEGAISAEH